MRNSTVMALVAFIFSLLVAGFAIAEGNIDVVGDNRNNNSNITDVNTTVNNSATGGTGTGTGGTSNVDFVSKNPGTMPVAVSHGVALPTTMPKSGNLLTQASMQAYMGNCEPFSYTDFEVLIGAMEESGMEEWGDVNKRIQPYPYIKKKYPSLSKNEPVWFIDAKVLAGLNPAGVKVIGGFTYNSKFKKEKPVLPMYYNPRAYLDASKYGANVVVYSEQYFQGYSVPEGWGADVGAVISQISSGFTHGSSLAGGLGVAGGSNTEVGRTGAAYVFMRIEGFQADLCYSSASVSVTVTQQSSQVCDLTVIDSMIGAAERAIIGCTTWCFDNLKNRRDAAEGNIQMYACTGRREYLTAAIEHLRIAKKNYESPAAQRSISANQAEADAIMSKVYVDWAISVRITRGERALGKFIEVHNLDMNPSNLPKNFTP